MSDGRPATRPPQNKRLLNYTIYIYQIKHKSYFITS
jgi:hypothetical protein